MTKKKVILIALIIVVVLFGLKKPSQDKNVQTQSKYHNTIYFDEEQFIKGTSQAEINPSSLDYQVRGGVVPHHLLASYIIADFFKKLSIQKPQTIILIGPNHEEKGNYKVLSSRYLWKTEYGMVEPNLLLIDKLMASNLVKIDESVMPSDQSISALMPFISFYMPYVKIVPMLLSSKMTNEEIGILSDSLSEILKDKNTILVASVDFSHYLSFDQANARDLESITAIKKFGCKKLLTFDSDNLDSASSICTLLYSMLGVGATNIDILNHDNSATIQNSKTDFTTSYFSIFFH